MKLGAVAIDMRRMRSNSRTTTSGRQPIGQLELGDGRTIAEIWRVKFSCFDIILSLEHILILHSIRY